MNSVGLVFHHHFFLLNQSDPSKKFEADEFVSWRFAAGKPKFGNLAPEVPLEDPTSNELFISSRVPRVFLFKLAAAFLVVVLDVATPKLSAFYLLERKDPPPPFGEGP